MWYNEFETEQDDRLRIFWEPIETTAPKEAHPYTCYVDCIIFYKHPQHSRTTDFSEFDRVTIKWTLLGTRWTNKDIGLAALAPFVDHEGVIYELTTGNVKWCKDGWYMRWIGREVYGGDKRLIEARRMKN